jgi:hypothetical protein
MVGGLLAPVGDSATLVGWLAVDHLFRWKLDYLCHNDMAQGLNLDSLATHPIMVEVRSPEIRKF